MINVMSDLPLQVALRKCASASAGKRTGFLELVSGEREKMRQVSAAALQESDAGMTLEQYKQSIYQQISDMPRHTSRLLESVSISISDEGFEAMKNDPEYEKWVLDTIRHDFASDNPLIYACQGGYSVYTFGAEKEDYRAEGWYPGYAGGTGPQLFEQESQDSFWCSKSPIHEYNLEKSSGAVREEKGEGYWERRARIFKENLELTQELNLKRKILEEAQKRRAIMYGDEEHGYAAGVSAAELLSVVM